MAHLQHGEVGLARQKGFLLLRRVGVEAVLVQPVPQNLHRLLRQVAAATAFRSLSSSRQVERGVVLAVQWGRGVQLQVVLIICDWKKAEKTDWVSLRYQETKTFVSI